MKKSSAKNFCPSLGENTPAKFSLIICSRGRPLLLERALRGAALLRYPQFELIVIHDPSDPETTECLARHAPRARLGECHAANLSLARNTGLRMARGDVAAFLDDDSVPDPDWLDHLAQAYASPAVTAAGGYIRAGGGAGYQYRTVLIDEFGSDHRRHSPPRHLPPGWFVSLTGTNFSVRREAALGIGGFDENFPYFLEETDFLLRLRQAGGQIRVVPGAQVQHGRAANLSRDAKGVPKSLHGIARSKAYFAHINRRPETSLARIEGALRAFARRKQHLIRVHSWAGRLCRARAAQLRAELQRGLEEGAALAQSGRNLAAMLPADGKIFQAWQREKKELLF